jgi:hypothetical protein
MAKPRAKPKFEYATEFDKAMNEQFPGEGFKTEWNLFAGSWGGYRTTRANGRPLTKQHAMYGRGLSNGFATRKNFA